MVFLEDRPIKRETADYGHICLFEFWVEGVEAALSFMGRLFEGRESVGGMPIRNTFKRSTAHRENGRHGRSNWPSWLYEISAESAEGEQRLNLDPIPTVAKGLPPFKTPSEAVTDWMREDPRLGVVSGNVPHQDQLVIVIPDTRARFASCRWSPESLSVQVELNVPPKSVELQVIHAGSKSRFAAYAIQTGPMSLSVPEDARDLALYVVQENGDLLASQALSQGYRSFGDADSQDDDQSYWKAELQKGENESRLPTPMSR